MRHMVCEQVCFFYAQSNFLSVTVSNIFIFYRCCLDTQRELEEPCDACSNFRQKHINICLPSLKFGYLKLYRMKHNFYRFVVNLYCLLSAK
jgi:hypothetical protein